MPLKYQLLLLLYVIPLVVTCQSSGSCTTHNYEKIFSTTESSELFDLVETSDGGRIAVGYIGQMVNASFTTDSKALIMKLDNAGNLQWAKGIKGLADNYFKKVRQTTDGGYIAVGATKPPGAAFGSILMIRFDQSGGILWSRSLGNTIHFTEHVLDVIQTSDGGFALTGIQGQFLADQTVVIRTDGNGALLWEKNYAYSDQDMSFPGGIVEENDSLVVSGSFEIYHPTIPEKYVYLMKVNKNTGDVFWAKKYTGGGDWYPVFNKSNGGYYMDHPVLPGDATITKMDLSGNPIKTFDIHAYTQGSDFRYFPTADNGVIVSKKSTVLNLIKVRPDNTLEWANEYPVPSPSSWLTCLKETPTNQVIASGSLFYSPTHIDFLLINRPVNGIDSCPGMPITPVSTTVSPYPASPFTWLPVTPEPAFKNILINTTVTPENFTITNLCSTTSLSTCDTLKLSGTDSVCVNMDTLIFPVKRAPGCTTPVQFQIDPVKATIISSTDSSAKIVFIQPGNVKLYASISRPCGDLRDSVIIYARDCPVIIDSCSTFSFQNKYATPENEEVYDVEETTNGDMIAAGIIGPLVGNTDALIMRADRMGNVLWAKRIGGTGSDHFKKVRQTADGGFIAVGQTNSFAQNSGSILLVKFDQAGNIVWSKALGTGSVLTDKKFDVIQTSDGGYALTGEHSPQPLNELVVIRTDINGTLLWEKNYNMSPSNSNAAGGIA
jgi:hypothetical protein